MAVSKVIVVCVLIGFLSGQVNSRSLLWKSDSTKYCLPKALDVDDAFDIKFVNTNFFVISLVTEETKTACSFTVRLHDDINAEDQPQENDCHVVLKTSNNKFIENSTVAVNFTVRNHKDNDSEIVIIIGGPTGVVSQIIMNDYDKEEIKYLTVTGEDGNDLNLMELKFTFSRK